MGHVFSEPPAVKEEFSHNELKDAHWLFDTPGIMKERDVRPRPFLSTQDLLLYPSKSCFIYY